VTKVWDSFVLTHNASPGNFATSTLGLATSAHASSVPAGQTIVRTRLQVNLAISLLNTAPATQDGRQYEAGGTGIWFGLYMDKTGVITSPPAINDTGSEDGNWLQKNMLTLRGTDDILHNTNTQIFTAYYACDDGTYDSEGMRGPAASALFVYLVWALQSSGTPWWTDNALNYVALSRGIIQARILRDVNPP